MYHNGRRNRATRRFATTCLTIWLLTALLLSVTPAHAEQDIDPASTQYTSAEQRLLDAGFPSIDGHWVTKEFNAAQEAILSVSQDDPAGLPRLTKDRKGLFSRMLVEFDNFTYAMEEFYGQSETTEEYLKALQAVGQYTNEITLPIWQAFCYPPDGANMMYEREMLSVLPFLVRQTGLTAQIMSQMRQELVAAGIELTDEYKEHFQRYQAAQGGATNAMINVTINPGYRHTDLRAKLFIDCQEAWINLMQVLPQKDREDAIFKLVLLNKFNKNQEERDAINAIIGQE